MTKMKKKYKITLMILATFIIVTILGFLLFQFVLKPKKEEKPPITNTATVTNKIEGYDYTLDDRDTQLFENLFKELKENLENSEINEEEYAKTLAKLFIIDLFTIDNKTSKYDIGGLEYLHQDAKESFRSIILDTIYKTVEDNSDKGRKQELPVVKTIEILNINKTTYQKENSKEEAYEIELSWTYEQNLGYDTKAKITMIKEEHKLSIVAYNKIN
jgi:hypothetical protein